MVNAYPRTIGEALEALRAPNAAPVAGATDWSLRRRPADEPVFLFGVDALCEVEETPHGARIGAACTYAQLLEDARVPAMLKAAMARVAAPAIRNMGTLGGNVCNASPAGDTLPVLYALDATVHLEGPEGAREMRLEDFIRGVRKTALRPGELLASIFVPRFDGLWRVEKVGGRGAQAISKCSMAALVSFKNGRVARFAAAFGAVGMTVVRRRECEGLLLGAEKGEISALTPEVIRAYDGVIRPIDDQRSTAEYRHDVCLRLLGDFLKEVEEA